MDWMRNEIAGFLRLLAQRSLQVMPRGELHVCRDPDDNLLLETALLGGAHYVVSRDDDIKREQDLVTQMEARGITVLGIQRFLDCLEDKSL